MRDKGLEKLITFIVPLYIAKRKTQSIKLIVHYVHQKQILHISNKHHHDTLNEVFELLKSLSHQIILSHIKPMTFLRKKKSFHSKIFEALTRIIHLIRNQGTAY